MVKVLAVPDASFRLLHVNTLYGVLSLTGQFILQNAEMHTHTG